MQYEKQKKYLHYAKNTWHVDLCWNSHDNQSGQKQNAFLQCLCAISLLNLLLRIFEVKNLIVHFEYWQFNKNLWQMKYLLQGFQFSFAKTKI